MGSEATADNKFRIDRPEIVDVPILVGITENKIKRTRKCSDEVMRIGQTRVDELRNTCR